jgi:hypothetical protein
MRGFAERENFYHLVLLAFWVDEGGRERKKGEENLLSLSLSLSLTHSFIAHWQHHNFMSFLYRTEEHKKEDEEGKSNGIDEQAMDNI